MATSREGIGTTTQVDSDTLVSPGSGKVAFILSGGGSLGSVQVGCLEALLEHGIKPDLIVGTSVGALNGACLAKDPTLEGASELRDLWLSLGTHGPFMEGRLRVLSGFLLGRRHLYANTALQKLICQHLGNITFEELQAPTLIIASEVESGEPTVFERGPLEQAVLASSAIPGIFPPVNIGGLEYIDGAMLSNCGLKPAWDHGARRMVVIETPHMLPNQGFGVLKPLTRALSTTMTRLCHLEVAWFSEQCQVALIEPEVPLENLSFNDFSHTLDLMERGRAWTRSLLESEKGELLRSFARA